VGLLQVTARDVCSFSSEDVLFVSNYDSPLTSRLLGWVIDGE